MHFLDYQQYIPGCEILKCGRQVHSERLVIKSTKWIFFALTTYVFRYTPDILPIFGLSLLAQEQFAHQVPDASLGFCKRGDSPAKLVARPDFLDAEPITLRKKSISSGT